MVGLVRPVQRTQPNIRKGQKIIEKRLFLKSLISLSK